MAKAEGRTCLRPHPWALSAGGGCVRGVRVKPSIAPILELVLQQGCGHRCVCNFNNKNSHVHMHITGGERNQTLTGVWVGNEAWRCCFSSCWCWGLDSVEQLKGKGVWVF